MQELKKIGGDPKMFDCRPLKIKVVWEEEAKAVNYAGRAEWYKLTLIEEYYAYLLFTYENRQKKKLNAWDIVGPYPGENGLIGISVEDFEGSVTGENKGWISNPSEKYKEFSFDNVSLIIVTTREVNPPHNATCHFYAGWGRMTNITEVGFSSCRMERDSRGIMPDPYDSVYGGVFELAITGINASGPKALTYDEIMGGIKNGLVIKYFSEKQRGLTVDVTVFLEFGKK